MNVGDKITLSVYGIEAVILATAPSEGNPFMQDTDGATWLRYDCFTFVVIGGELTIQYYWQNKKTFTMGVKGDHRMVEGQDLTVTLAGAIHVTVHT